jgi:hypothetical protein
MLVKRMQDLINTGIFKDNAALGRSMGESPGNIRNWLVIGIKANKTKTAKIEHFLRNYDTSVETPPEQVWVSVKRKADIIANSAEVMVPLLKWFIREGTEEHREFLRKVLGTDLSYDLFNVARALLTEQHLERVNEDKAI